MLSASERSDSDSWPIVCATAIFSAIFGRRLERHRGDGLGDLVAALVARVEALVDGEHADVADDRLGGAQRRAVAAARDLLGQDEVDPVAREDEAGDARGRGHADGDGAHARAERRGEEAALAGADDASPRSAAGRR